jgi:hypothetical protein
MSKETQAAWFATQLKGHPLCTECQCYPECRKDCPDNLRCHERMPVYDDTLPKDLRALIVEVRRLREIERQVNELDLANRFFDV